MILQQRRVGIKNAGGRLQIDCPQNDFWADWLETQNDDQLASSPFFIHPMKEGIEKSLTVDMVWDEPKSIRHSVLTEMHQLAAASLL